MTVYSQQARSMSEQYYVKLEEAQGWIDRHRQTYNVFHTWADEMSDLGSARGWIETAYPERVRFTNELNAKGGEGSGPASVNHCINLGAFIQ